jgi:SAM-dependent MidA family methyltransferase
MMKALFPDDGSPVSFEAFMAYALHDPHRGYYARRISTVGRGGDFTTTAEISPALSKAIAAWLIKQLRATRCRDVIELGPGSGALAVAVKAHLPWIWRMRTRWHLVETSATLREIQARHPALRNARWHDSVESALGACGGAACLYSNEFFDAFPVRLFQRSTAGWQEVFVQIMDGAVKELLLEEKGLPPSCVWRRDWAAGQRVEIHDSVRQWLAAMAIHWRRGAMLTIDYGASLEEIYHRQPCGSLRAYFMQQRITGAGIYENVGRQDLTADVNFSDMLEWTSAFAESAPLRSQRDFLLPWVNAGNPGDVHAVDPHGAGEAFRVWECWAG